MSEEEVARPFMNEKQRDWLSLLDKMRLTTVLSKFCAKNCGLFKSELETTFPIDCLSYYDFYLK